MIITLFNAKDATFNNAVFAVPSFVLDSKYFQEGVQECYNHVTNEALIAKVESARKALETAEKNGADKDIIKELESNYNNAVDTKTAFRTVVEKITISYDAPALIYCFSMIKASNDFNTSAYHGISAFDMIEMIKKHMNKYSNNMGDTWDKEHKESFTYVKGKLNEFISDMFGIKGILSIQENRIRESMKDAPEDDIKKAVKEQRYYKPVDCKLSTSATLRIFHRVSGEYKVTTNKQGVTGLKFKAMQEVNAFCFIMREVLAINGCVLSEKTATFTI